MAAVDLNALQLGRELGVAEARYSQLDDLQERIRSIEIFLGRYGFTGEYAPAGDFADDAPAAAAPAAPAAAGLPDLATAMPAINDFMRAFEPAGSAAPKPGGS